MSESVYESYAGRPVLIEGVVDERGAAECVRERYGVQAPYIFDLLQPTIFGLLDDLVDGSELKNRFMEEYEQWPPVFCYYPDDRALVKLSPAFWHRLALLARNSELIRDPDLKLSWQEIRDVFERSVLAVAGCSLGNGVAHALAFDLRPARIKVADQKDYHLTNGNRVRLSYREFGRNKAGATALQLQSVDPFMGVSVFAEGIHPGNVDDFIIGSALKNEPRATVILEETDDPDAKIFIRERARIAGIPVVMGSDIGSAGQVDIRRFDLIRDLSLAPGVTDDELFEHRDDWKKDLANRDKFYDFAFALIGHHYLKAREFERLIHNKKPPLFAGVPQLGSTAMVAAALAAEATARLLLGHRLPERMFFNKHTGETIIEGAYL
ncbi:MAG: ThiF family adenylyltransferase [bacterium]|nr:ThiF family adenylyltransferase [bacterium]